MQFAVALVALVATALAAPSEQLSSAKRACQPGTYICSGDATTMEVCDFDGYYKRLDPGCPTGTRCSYPPNAGGLPFCTVPPEATAKKAKRDGASCSSPNQFTCTADLAAIQICDLQGQLQEVGPCPANTHCGYIGNIPFCLSN